MISLKNKGMSHFPLLNHHHNLGGENGRVFGLQLVCLKSRRWDLDDQTILDLEFPAMEFRTFTAKV